MTATLPHNPEAEQSVLGAALLGENVVEAAMVERGLRPEHFHREGHALVFAAMAELIESDRRVDVVTLCDRLAAKGQLDQVGGAVAVDALAGAVPAAGNWSEYAAIVVRDARHREQVRVGKALAAAGYSRDEAAAARAEAELGRTDSTADTTVWPDQAADEAWDYLSQEGPVDGLVLTPWPRINHAFGGGLHPGNVTVLGAWSSRGKSCIADGIVEHAAAKQALRGAILLNEMSTRERTLRFTASLSGVPFERLMDRQRLSADDRGKAARGLDAFRRLGIPLVPIAGWPVQDIARRIRRGRWDIVAIDLLGRIPNPPGVTSRTAAVDEISRTLNDVALQANCHIVLVVQLNQERNKGAAVPAPVRRDIRESGAIANDAANVLFVHRRQVELETADGQPTGIFEDLNDATLYTDKQRNGPGGHVETIFIPQRMRFREAA